LVSGPTLRGPSTSVTASVPLTFDGMAKFSQVSGHLRSCVRPCLRGGVRHARPDPGVARDQRATRILADIDETEAEIGNLVLSPRSHLRIGAPSEIGRSRIANARQFGPSAARYPLTWQCPHAACPMSSNRIGINE
jgi:hypothetical protein